MAAPFDGTISLRAVDPFVDVQAGQMLFQLDAEGGIEASFGLPETLLAQVTIGMPASVALPRRAELADATITEIDNAIVVAENIGPAFSKERTARRRRSPRQARSAGHC